MGGVFDPRVFSAETHNVGGEADGEAQEREARERAKSRGRGNGNSAYRKLVGGRDQMMGEAKKGWVAECTMHGWTMLFADDLEAAQKEWRKHLADHPGDSCGLMGPGVYREGGK